jgi:hypothetical protein
MKDALIKGVRRAHTHKPNTSNKGQPYTSYIDPTKAEGSDDEVEL